MQLKGLLETEYNKVNLKTTIMSLNYLKVKHKNSLLELLQKYEKMFDGTLGKYPGSIYNIKGRSKALSRQVFSQVTNQL